jgi:hypothetical protein
MVNVAVEDLPMSDAFKSNDDPDPGAEEHEDAIPSDSDDDLLGAQEEEICCQADNDVKAFDGVVGARSCARL